MINGVFEFQIMYAMGYNWREIKMLGNGVGVVGEYHVFFEFFADA